MKRCLLLAFAILVNMQFAAAAVPKKRLIHLRNSEKTDEVIFLKYKCNNCHSISAAGIGKNLKINAPNLTNVTVRHESDWIRKFIKKEVGHISCVKVDSSRNGKFHVIKFQGDKEEEDSLIEWLERFSEKKK